MSNGLVRPSLIALALAWGLSGCRSTPIEDRAPPVARLGAAPAATDLLETGRAIYMGQCAKCHKAKSVQAYSAEDWSTRILPKMAKKAKLNTAQADAVLAYVLAAHGEQPVSNPGR